MTVTTKLTDCDYDNNVMMFMTIKTLFKHVTRNSNVKKLRINQLGGEYYVNTFVIQFSVLTYVESPNI